LNDNSYYVKCYVILINVGYYRPDSQISIETIYCTPFKRSFI